MPASVCVFSSMSFLIDPPGLDSESVDQSGMSHDICFYPLQGVALLFVSTQRPLKQEVSQIIQ